MADKKTTRTPKFRHHKASGQGFVELNGRRLYLGRYELPETRQRYHQTVAEWLAAGRQLPVPHDEITVVELCARFMDHALAYYRAPDGRPTGELDGIRQAIRPLVDLYGDALAARFGPLALMAIRQKMIGLGWCRSSVNHMIGRLKRVFRWAVEQELVKGDVWHALNAVQGLRRGRSDAPESPPVAPVPQAHIDAIAPHVSRQVWALVQLQLLTAARAGELVVMRPVDLDVSGRVWLYRPERHKTAHHGHGRTVYLGPRAQEICGRFLARPVGAFMFSAAEAEEERQARRHLERRTPEGQGNGPGTNRKAHPKRRPRDRYTTETYNRAIQRGCQAAFPLPADLARQPKETVAAWKARLTPEQAAAVKQWRHDHGWHVHQLRHNAGTFLRKEFGLEVARIILGHRSAAVAEIYAEVDERKAVDVIGQVG